MSTPLQIIEIMQNKLQKSKINHAHAHYIQVQRIFLTSVISVVYPILHKIEILKTKW